MSYDSPGREDSAKEQVRFSKMERQEGLGRWGKASSKHCVCGMARDRVSPEHRVPVAAGTVPRRDRGR